MATGNEIKKGLSCIVCDMILDEPVSFPCECDTYTCKEHLRDGKYAKDNKIKCPTCNKEFQTKSENFRPSRFVKNLLNNQTFLSEEEKQLKSEIQSLIDHFRQKFEKFTKEAQNFDFYADKHFGMIRNQIDLHREELKDKIYKIALKKFWAN